MACGTPLCFFKPVLIVAALAGVGMGGYNIATKGCPLGSCDRGAKAVTASHTSQTPEGVCPITGRQRGEAGAVLTASENQNPACDGSGCSTDMMAACEAMGVCPMGGAGHCDQADDSACPMGGGDCHEAAPASGPVADSDQAKDTETSEG